MAARKTHDLFRRFVLNALGIDAIRHEELYLMAWMADLLLLVYTVSRILEGRLGRYLLYGFVLVAGLVFLVWYGKKHGKKSVCVASPDPEFIVVGLLLSKRTLARLEEKRIDVKNFEEFSRYVNELLAD